MGKIGQASQRCIRLARTAERCLQSGEAWKLLELVISQSRYVSIRNPRLSLHMLICYARGNVGAGRAAILKMFGLRVLNDTLKACRELQLRPFLAFGSLLGHVRDGGFIAHDTDIDLGLLHADVERRTELVEPMRRLGYAVRASRQHYISFRPQGRSHPSIDLYAFKHHGDVVLAQELDRESGRVSTFSYPSDLFEKMEQCKFAGVVDTLMPSAPERFLEAVYGDWRTSCTTWDKIESPHNRVDARTDRLL